MKHKTSRRVRPKEWAQLDTLGKRLEQTETHPDGAHVAAQYRALGQMLRRIAAGEDAREVFGQTSEGGRQHEGVFNFTRAAVYWRERALGRSPAEATKAAQDHFPELPRPSASTIERNARRYQEPALEFVEGRSHTRRADGTLQIGPPRVDISTLRAHLTRKAKGGNKPK